VALRRQAFLAERDPYFAELAHERLDVAAEEAETNDELVALFDANPEEESNVG